MRCLKSSAEIQNARQQSRPQGCLSVFQRIPVSIRKSRTTAVRRKKKRVTARYFDRGHSRGLFLLAIDSNQRCRDALLEMTDDRGEAWLSPLYWCTVEPLLGSLLTLSASPIGTRCQDTEVITPCTRLCSVGILWLSENRLPQILLPRARPALHAVVATRLSHIRHGFALQSENTDSSSQRSCVTASTLPSPSVFSGSIKYKIT